jgi:hypothetical protein
MAIATAVVIGNILYVRDERGQTLFTRSVIGGELMVTGRSYRFAILRMCLSQSDC